MSVVGETTVALTQLLDGLSEANGGGVTVSSNGETTWTADPATPPKSTFVTSEATVPGHDAPVVPVGHVPKSDPKTVTLAVTSCGPPKGLTPVTLGIATDALSSTNSKTDPAPAGLDCPVVEVTTTSAGPAPSWVGFGEFGGVVATAAGKVTVSVVPFSTWKLVALAEPTSTLATLGLPAVPKPEPETVTASPAVVGPDEGLSPVTTGGFSFPA